MNIRISRSGPLEVNRQPGIEKSDYQARLEKKEHGEKIDGTAPHAHNVRFWSDFNRVYHAPHSLHPLPSPAPGGNATQPVVQQWDEGIQLYRRQDSVCGRSATPAVADLQPIRSYRNLRSWKETFGISLKSAIFCRSQYVHIGTICIQSHLLLCQGFQVSFDSDTFGSFTLEMVENVHDEMPKAPILTFANLARGKVSDADPQLVRYARLYGAESYHSLITLSTRLIKLGGLSTNHLR